MRNETKAMLEQMLSGQTANDRAAIDMKELETRVSRLVDCALVYAHAVDYMKAHTEVHPLIAFIHACECTEIPIVGGPITDAEFIQMVTAWRGLCHTPRTNALAAEMERRVYNPFEIRE